MDNSFGTILKQIYTIITGVVWIEIDKSESARKSVMELNHGKAIVPTIIFPDGSMLSEPTFSDLTE